MIELEKIIEIIKSTGVVKDITKYDPEKTFQDNGIDSLDTFTIFLAVEEQLGIKFSEKESEQIATVVEMIESLNKR